MPAIRRTYSQRRSMKSKSTYGAKRRLWSDKYKVKTDTTNLNVTAWIPRNRTTMALNSGPFKPLMKYNFEYSNALTAYAPATAFGVVSVKPNDLYDFDSSGHFGNKQPLFYDILLSSTGPYKQYRVLSWVITYTVINNATAPVTVFAQPSLSALNEMDALQEADNYPGVQRLFLSEAGSSNACGTLTVKGSPQDVYPTDKYASSLAGQYNTSPSGLIYGGMCFGAVSGNVSVSIAIKATLYTQLGQIDALVS